MILSSHSLFETKMDKTTLTNDKVKGSSGIPQCDRHIPKKGKGTEIVRHILGGQDAVNHGCQSQTATGKSIIRQRLLRHSRSACCLVII